MFAPNHRVEVNRHQPPCLPGRCDFMIASLHSNLHGQVAVTHPGRSVSVDALGGFPETHRGESNTALRIGSFWMPTSDIWGRSARSASDVAGNRIRIGQTDASGGRINSPPMDHHRLSLRQDEIQRIRILDTEPIAAGSAGERSLPSRESLARRA